MIDGKTRLIALNTTLGAAACSLELIESLLEKEWASDGADGADGADGDFRHSSDYLGRLHLAKDSLISFVVTHMPEQATALCQEIDQIRHNDQLKAIVMAVLSMAYQANPDETRELYKTGQQLLED